MITIVKACILVTIFSCVLQAQNVAIKLLYILAHLKINHQI